MTKSELHLKILSIYLVLILSSNWQISNSTIGTPKPSQIGLNITENTSLRRFFNNKMVCNAFGEKSLIVNLGTFYKNYNIKEVSDTLHRYMYLNQEKEVYSINTYLYNIEDNYFEVDVVLEKVKVSKDNVYSHKRKKKVRLKFW